MSKERLLFANNLRRARQAAGLTPEQLGHRARLSTDYVQAVEEGTIDFKLDEMARLARAVGHPLHALLSA